MKTASNKFLRGLGVGLVGLLALLLFVFFVTVFVSGRMGMSKSERMTSSVMPTMSPRPMAMKMDGRGSGMATSRGMEIKLESDTMMPVMNRKVMKNGNLNLQVSNVDDVVSRVNNMVGEFGGIVSDSQLNQLSGGVKGGSLTVKVEVGKFDEAMARFKELAIVVVSENTSGMDVTEQVIDLQAHISNKKAAEATLQSLFERAEKVSDVIEITDKLAMVRSEIESLEGQMRYLESQTDMATISLFLTEDVSVMVDQGFRPVQTIKESLVLLIGLFGELTQGLIRFALVVFPAFVMSGLMVWVLYRGVRRALLKFWPGSLPEKRRILRKK